MTNFILFQMTQKKLPKIDPDKIMGFLDETLHRLWPTLRDFVRSINYNPQK